MRRLAGRHRRPADARIRNHQGVRPRLALQRARTPWRRWPCGRSTTPIASCRRSIPTSASASTATSATSNIEGFEAQIGQRLGSVVDAERLGRRTPRANCSRTCPFGVNQLADAVPAAQGQGAGGNAEVDLLRCARTSTSPKTCTSACRARRWATASRRDLNDEMTPGLHRRRPRHGLRLQDCRASSRRSCSST